MSRDPRKASFEQALAPSMFFSDEVNHKILRASVFQSRLKNQSEK